MHTHLLGASLLLGPSVCGAGPPLPLCGPPPLAGSPPSGCPLPPAGIAWASHSFGPPQLSLGPPHPLWASPTLWVSTSVGPYPLSLPLLQASLCEPPSIFGSPLASSPMLLGLPNSLGIPLHGLGLSGTPTFMDASSFLESHSPGGSTCEPGLWALFDSLVLSL